MTHRPLHDLIAVVTYVTARSAGVRNHVLAAKYAAPLMIAKKRGLVVTVTSGNRNRYTGHFYYDPAKAAMTRLSFGIAHDLRAHGTG